MRRSSTPSSHRPIDGLKEIGQQDSRVSHYNITLWNQLHEKGKTSVRLVITKPAAPIILKPPFKTNNKKKEDVFVKYVVTHVAMCMMRKRVVN